ncbi:MAG: helix-turn-helix transcriptional regulator [Gammaproteobacteria bacterium]|nr:helix-turn-helix transcriptional regulator [Gammaproteobacteria bacterium]
MRNSAASATKVFDGIGATSAETPKILEVPLYAPVPAGAIDIDDLAREFEAQPGGGEALAEGRQWVADRFYSEHPRALAAMRLRKGWSQAELARRVGTSQSHIARIETGHADPQLSTVKKLAKALEVEVADVAEAIIDGD